jgi:hypothetical protein
LEAKQTPAREATALPQWTRGERARQRRISRPLFDSVRERVLPEIPPSVLATGIPAVVKKELSGSSRSCVEAAAVEVPVAALRHLRASGISRRP